VIIFTIPPSLTPAFAVGWNKLADELKLDIIKHITTRSGAICWRKNYSENFENILLPLLACPEMAPFVMEAFDRYNITMLRGCLFRIPNFNHMIHIRKLRLECNISSPTDWNLVTRIGNGTLALPNLKSVYVFCYAVSDMDKPWKDKFMENDTVAIQATELLVYFFGDRRQKNIQNAVFQKLTIHNPEETRLEKTPQEKEWCIPLLSMPYVRLYRKQPRQ
jgi:hypothetical protein